MPWISFASSFDKLEPYSAFYGVSSFITGHSIPWKYLHAVEAGDMEDMGLKSSSISSILTHSRGKLATDAKDKVYALYGIFKTMNVRLAEPDYNKDIIEIYKEATVAAMVCDYSLSILKQAAGKKLIEGLPSWVPDWSDSRIRQFPADSCRANWNIPMQIAFTLDPEVLVLQGSVAGFVHDTPPVNTPKTFDLNALFSKQDQDSLDQLARDYIQIAKTLRDWVHTLLCHRHGVDELALMLMQGRLLGSYESAFHIWLRFLMAGWPGWSLDEVYREKNYHKHSFPGLEIFYQNHALHYWTEQLEWQILLAIHANDQSRSFHYIVCAALNGRELLSCTSTVPLHKNMVCLVANEVELGDWLVLFAGAEFPMIVRQTLRTTDAPQPPVTPIAHNQEYYSLIGPAYIIGNMHANSGFSLDKEALDSFHLI